MGMIELKYAKFWLSLGFGLVLAVVVLSLMPPPPDALSLPSDKLNHFIAYATLMAWFAQLYPRCVYGRLALAFVCLGILLECLQALTGYRFFEYADMLANSLGVLLAWALCLTPLASLLLRFELKFCHTHMRKPS
jgi:VanZ family protein